MTDYYGPIPLWWWSGAPLDTERLCWQLDRLMEGGVRQAVVISLAPAGPLWGCPADEPEFMSDAWWEIFRSVCGHAAERGFGLWFYDQLGFSGANIQGRVTATHPAARGRRLLPAQPGNPLPDGAQPVGTQAYSLPGGFDYLDPAACAHLFEAVHGELERRAGEFLGTVIKGTFQDELPSMPEWSAAFADEFHRRRGYRLEPHVAALWQDIGPDTGPVRRDYQLTRAELAEEAFFRPLHDWHAKHGLLVGCDQQEPARGGHQAAGVRYYADYARTHRWFTAPGSDHWGDGKRHSSLAHAHGHPRVWIEAFHSTGWGGTLEETLDWLIPWLRAGANLYNPHAVYYSTEQGRFEWAPPSTCWRQPYWPHYGQFAETVATLCRAVAQGAHVCDIAVLDPATTVQQELSPFADEQDIYLDKGDWPQAHRVYQDLVGVMSWHDFRPGLLDRLRLDFDVLDESSIQRAGPQMELADERYSVVILPAARALEPETARVLTAFAEAGGTLIGVGSLPEHAAGLHDDDADIRALRDLFNRGTAIACATLQEAERVLAGLPRRVEAEVPTLLRTSPDGGHVLLVPAAFPMATQARIDGYTFQPANQRDTTVGVRGDFASAELIALEGGPATALPVRRDGDSLRITVPFDTAPVALIRLGASASPPAALRVFSVTTVDGPWTATPLPMLDNRHGDFPRVPGAEATVPLQLWRMERLDATGAWQQTRATFGEWAICGPVADAAGPAEATQLARDGLQTGLDWRSVAFSPIWGPERPPGFPPGHGNKGYVQEEFAVLGRMTAGDRIVLRAVVNVPQPGAYVLTVGAPGAKMLWLDGIALSTSDGYHAEVPVTVDQGHHLLEVHLTAHSDENMVASYVLAAAAEWQPRPQWLSSPSGIPLTATLHSESGGTAKVLLGSVGPAVLRCNGIELARHGEFDNYSWLRMPRVATYEVDFRVGDNVVEVELGDQGSLMLVDVAGPGGERLSSTPRRWATAAADHRMFFDQQVLAVEPYPHPLDGAAAPVPLGGRAGERLRLSLPPGTSQISVPGRTACRAWCRGAELASAEPGVFTIDSPARGGEPLELVFDPDARWSGAALLTGPVTVTATTGPIELGDWSDAGLGDFSGGLAYETEITMPGAANARLRLGEVRGTAEVFVDGNPAGGRLWSPYTFDLALAAGRHLLRIVVRNTLAPYLAAVNPHAWVLPGQERSGLFGPVTLEVFDD